MDKQLGTRKNLKIFEYHVIIKITFKVYTVTGTYRLIKNN